MGLGPLKRGGGARRAPWGLGKAGLGKTAGIRVVVVARATPGLDRFNPRVTAEGGGRWARSEQRNGWGHRWQRRRLRAVTQRVREMLTMVLAMDDWTGG